MSFAASSQGQNRGDKKRERMQKTGGLYTVIGVQSRIIIFGRNEYYGE